jgi:hypothetical protein
MGTPSPVTYETSLVREGVEVRIVVDVQGEHVHPDLDEWCSEVIAHAAAQVSARVRESIAQGQMRDPF